MNKTVEKALVSAMGIVERRRDYITETIDGHGERREALNMVTVCLRELARHLMEIELVFMDGKELPDDWKAREQIHSMMEEVLVWKRNLV